MMIETRELTRRFDKLVAVDRIDLTVECGEIFGLIGPNGAGKSTLIRMLTTLLPPTSGLATVAGFDIVKSPAAVRQHIGYVPQLLSADGSLTGYENLLLSARLYGVPRRERAERIARALEWMELSEAAGHLASHYSGGMLRRLEIAQSLLHGPGVLFLDEPTVGLDPLARETVWHRLLELKKSARTTMVVTTHRMDEINEYCDRIALMDRGRMIATGTAQELKASVGPGASMDDVFIRLVGARAGSEPGSYRDVRLERGAEKAHG